MTTVPIESFTFDDGGDTPDHNTVGTDAESDPAVTSRVEAILRDLKHGRRLTESAHEKRIKRDLVIAICNILVAASSDNDDESQLFETYINKVTPIVDDVFKLRHKSFPDLFDFLSVALSAMDDTVDFNSLLFTNDDEDSDEDNDRQGPSLVSRFSEALMAVVNISSHNTDGSQPAHQDAHYIMTQAVNKEYTDLKEADETLTHFAELATNIIRRCTPAHRRYTRKDTKTFLNRYLSENGDKLADTSMGSTQKRADFLTALCKFGNIDRRTQEYRDEAESFADLAINFIKKYAKSDKHKRFVDVLDEFSSTVSNVSLETIFGIDIYREADVILKNKAYDLSMLRSGTPEPDSESPANAFYKPKNTRKFDQLYGDTVETLVKIADNIKEEVIPRDLYDAAYNGKGEHAEEYQHILSINDLDELKLLISETRITGIHSLLIRSYAVARLMLIHAALLVLIEYSEQLSIDATNALIRRLSSSQHFKQIKHPIVEHYKNKNDEENAKAAMKKYGKYAFEIVGLPGSFVHIAEPKSTKSVGRKALTKTDFIELLSVVRDGVRFVCVHPDEKFKNKEDALAVTEQALARLIPVIGTDFELDRSKLALTEGSKTNENSTQKRRSAQFTFRFKFARYWRARSKNSKVHGDLKGISTEVHHEPFTQFITQYDRCDYEGKLRSKARDTLGLNTKFTDFFAALASKAVEFDEYNDSVNPAVASEMTLVRSRIAINYGEHVNDPLTSIYEYLLDLLTGPDVQVLQQFVRESIRSKPYTKLTYATLYSVLCAFAQQAPDDDRFTVAAQNMQVALNL